MVQRTKAGGISQMGRATQGVRVMNIKDDDRVSAVALVVESSADVADEAESVAEAPLRARRPPIPPPQTSRPSSLLDGWRRLTTLGVECDCPV